MHQWPLLTVTVSSAWRRIVPSHDKDTCCIRAPWTKSRTTEKLRESYSEQNGRKTKKNDTFIQNSKCIYIRSAVYNFSAINHFECWLASSSGLIRGISRCDPGAVVALAFARKLAWLLKISYRIRWRLSTIKKLKDRCGSAPRNGDTLL